MTETEEASLTHRWEVEEREIRRHLERRGRRHAFEHLDPRRTALVVIDMVPFFVDGSGFVRGIVPPINTTAALLRSLGGTVAWVVPAGGSTSPVDEEFYGAAVAATYSQSGGSGPIRDRLWPNICCESSVRDARTLGYRVVMLADANAAPTDEMLNATLRTVYRSFGDVRPTNEIRQLLADQPAE